jgi:hypothetical protein
VGGWVYEVGRYAEKVEERAEGSAEARAEA